MYPEEFLPLELVFMPSWWHHNYGISFDEGFYMDKTTRVENEARMESALCGRFGGVLSGLKGDGARPVIGSRHVAGGFIMPALMGCEIRFAEDAAPWPVERGMDEEEVLALEAPDFVELWPMKQLIQQMDALEKEFGHVEGDFDLDGVLNLALHLRGQRLFTDMFENPGLVHHLAKVCAQAMADVGEYVRSRTGTVSIATNRSIINVDPGLFLHSNCSVQMISPGAYEEFFLGPELYLAERLRPYGIHHCGAHMERYAPAYAKTPAAFYDVGWGSDAARCRELLPDAFLNLRLDPVRMKNLSPQEVAEDTEMLLSACPSPERAGICCINMDFETPDDNVYAVFEVVERHRRGA